MKDLIQHNSKSQQQLQRDAFERLEDVLSELEWLSNIHNKNTRRAYLKDIQQFQQFSGITELEAFRDVTRAHVIAFRDYLQRQELAAATIRRKIAAISALFDHLCNTNAVRYNPCAGVKRPTEGANEGKTPALSSEQAKKILTAPSEDTLKGIRDRALLAILLYHGLRREELCKLKIKDIETRQGIPHLCVKGKRDRIHYVPIHPAALRLVDTYRAFDCLIEEPDTPLFRPVRNNTSKILIKHLSPDAIYKIVRFYALKAGILSEILNIGAHAMRATAATNALEHAADITKVQELLGHSNISTTKLYDRRSSNPEDSAVFKIEF
mgnify:CR=1 FL=1